MNTCRQRRSGFTLIELLVVIAIIAILIALLVPAVQKVREAAARAACSNNLHQLSIAVHGYHDARKTLPRNMTINYGYDINGRSWSWLAAILPYCEQTPLYKSILNNPASNPNPYQPFSAVLGAYGTQVSVFLCPSDSSNSSPRTDRANTGGYACGCTSYKGCSGSNWAWGSYTNAGPSGDWNGLDHGDGIFFRSDNLYPLNLLGITDGTSNTLMIGEDLGDIDQHCGWPNANYSNATACIPLNSGMSPGQPGYQNYGDWPDVYSFHSRHTGGANFAFADARVQFVSDSIDLNVYRALATRSGNEVASPPD